MANNNGQRRRLALLLVCGAVLAMRCGAGLAGSAFAYSTASPPAAAKHLRGAVGGVEFKSLAGIPTNLHRVVAVSGAARGGQDSVTEKVADAMLTAIVAGLSLFSLTALGNVTQKAFGLPMWGPPLGAITLIFASESAGLARQGKLFDLSAILKKAIAVGAAAGGANFLAVACVKILGPSALTRAISVGVASLFMTLFPWSGYFAPAGAFCALYVDQAIASGAIAKLGFKYALFPCASGTVFLLVASRIYARLVVTPLKAASIL